MLAEKINFGVIGFGLRAYSVIYHIKEIAGERLDIVAYHDFGDNEIPLGLERFKGAFQPERMASAEAVINHPQVNAVLIASPNGFHLEAVKPAIQSGKLTFLEKPLAATLADSREMFEFAQQYGGRVMVGFPMRFAPFYRKVPELIQSGKLGRISYIHAEEQMGAALTGNVYLRGWRANKKISGPLLLEKCCHDMDYFNWMLGGSCESVYSISDTAIFAKDSKKPTHCSKCDETPQECAYRCGDLKPSYEGEFIYANRIPDKCVFNMDVSVPDHTSVLLKYPGGIHVSFNVSMGYAKTRRIVSILGSRASLFADTETLSIKIQDVHQDIEPEVIQLPTPDSGHLGGDGGVAEEFIDLFDHPEKQCVSNIKAGYESAKICFAADLSEAERRPVSISESRD